MSRYFVTLSLALLAFPGSADPTAGEGIAAGFTLSVLTDDVPNARQMAETESGLLLVGTRRAGKVYAVVPVPDGPPEVVTFAEGLTMPSGLVLIGGDLYVAALDRVLRYADIERRFSRVPRTRDCHRRPAGQVPPRLEVPVGGPGRLPLRAGGCAVQSLQVRGSAVRQHPAHGSAHTARRPSTPTAYATRWVWPGIPRPRELWFTDNGRDMLGDDIPPEEVNRVEKAGDHYGYPHIHGTAIPDPEFGQDHDPADYVAPAHEIQAHAGGARHRLLHR